MEINSCTYIAEKICYIHGHGDIPGKSPADFLCEFPEFAGIPTGITGENHPRFSGRIGLEISGGDPEKFLEQKCLSKKS